MSEANTARLTRDAASAVAARAGMSAPVHPERIGIVHLGIGAFHRAHQAVYTERAMAATGDLNWGILGVTQRSATVRDQLRPQGGVYGVLTAGAVDGADGADDDAGGDRAGGQGEGGTRGPGRGLAVGADLSLELVGAVVDVAYPAEETQRVLDTLSTPTTHVVTLTITEKGYARLPDGGLDVDRVRPDLEALAAGEATPSSSAIGLLVRGIAARQRAGGAPLTVLTCDNMVENGKVLERLVREAVDVALPGEAGATLRNYLDEDVRFPCSMVDRIVPATTPQQRDLVAEALEVRDEGLVGGEPFTQWVIEDNFAGPRPAWEAAGATFTHDVAAFEQAKLRLLNGTHSLLAYAGACAGHATIAEAVTDPEIAKQARTYLFDDALPTLTPPDGLDLHAYGEEILRRFANPHTGHTTVQVAMDGTQKIPFRWGGVLEDALPEGQIPLGVAFGVASWTRFVRRRTLAAAGFGTDVPGGTGQGVDDPRGDELAALVETPGQGRVGRQEEVRGQEEVQGQDARAAAPERAAGESSAADNDESAEIRRLLTLPGLLPTVPEDFVSEVLSRAAG